MAVRHVRREAKRQRVQCARKEAHGKGNNGNEVAQVVAEMSVEQQLLRRQQAAEVRQALDERRRQRAKNEEARVGVNLVQRGSTIMAETTENCDGTRVEAGDGLPTAMMLVNGTTRCVKIDSGARYSVAGTDWMTRGECKTMDAPVTYIEGIGGFLLDVLSVWTFDMVNAYRQAVTIDACIVDGCTDEFLVGVDFLERHKATMDFDRCELRYEDHNQFRSERQMRKIARRE
ncbi:unnamed protein product [Phytophthora fragariaefolia]|uniref:Unnamed protein product n=1 Tax=Phytophthora fragariaefolia TaxID=1490495 RepID=A0A9W7CRK6_9STRA|nr:unnamed protein product [Phytophthora fragariaefolia]